jgi:hypothetical protein
MFWLTWGVFVLDISLLRTSFVSSGSLEEQLVWCERVNALGKSELDGSGIRTLLAQALWLSLRRIRAVRPTLRTLTVLSSITLLQAPASLSTSLGDFDKFTLQQLLASTGSNLTLKSRVRLRACLRIQAALQASPRAHALHTQALQHASRRIRSPLPTLRALAFLLSIITLFWAPASLSTSPSIIFCLSWVTRLVVGWTDRCGWI